MRILVPLLVACSLHVTVHRDAVHAQPGLVTAIQQGTADSLEHYPGTALRPLGSLGHVERRGNGPVHLILIPGAAFGWQVWEDFMTRNAQAYTMFAITPPGNAGSAAWPLQGVAPERYIQGHWTRLLVQAVDSLIRAERLHRPVVVGHHFLGGYHALKAGLSLTTQIGGVMVIADNPASATPNRKDPTGRQQMSLAERHRWLVDEQVPYFRTIARVEWDRNGLQWNQLTIDPERGARLTAEMRRVPLPIQLTYMLEYFADDIREQLGSSSIPVRVLQPESNYDRLHPNIQNAVVQRFGSIDSARQAVKRFADPWDEVIRSAPHITLRKVPGTGAFMMFDQPDVVDTEVAAFTEAVRKDNQERNTLDALVSRYYHAYIEAAENRPGGVEEFLRLFRDDVTFEDATFDLRATGKAEFRSRVVEQSLSAYRLQNVRFAIERRAYANSWAVVEGVFRATANGKAISRRFTTWLRFHEGLVAQQIDYFTR